MKFFSVIILLSGFCVAPAWAQEHVPNPQPFDQWLQEFERQAEIKGIKPETLQDAFANTSPIDRVITLDQKQPESTITLTQYLKNVVTKKRVQDGQDLLEEHRELLTEIGKRYGVQPKFIVALWGIETGYGHNTGGFQTIDALATLAYDGRRSDFFRDELMDALQILQDEHMAAADMKGSWAGALGQCQFMPSSFIKYAVDYDGDGKRDIWDDEADVFASIANYLKTLGWKPDEGWGRPVELPEGFDITLADISKPKSLAEWKRLGVRWVDGGTLPSQTKEASLALVGKDEDAVPYLVYGNYRALLQWNRSRFFATAVGTLADKIGQ